MIALARATFVTALLLVLAAQAHAKNDLFDLEWMELAPGVHVGQRPDPMRYPSYATT